MLKRSGLQDTVLVVKREQLMGTESCIIANIKMHTQENATFLLLQWLCTTDMIPFVMQVSRIVHALYSNSHTNENQ